MAFIFQNFNQSQVINHKSQITQTKQNIYMIHKSVIFQHERHPTPSVSRKTVFLIALGAPLCKGIAYCVSFCQTSSEDEVAPSPLSHISFTLPCVDSVKYNDIRCIRRLTFQCVHIFCHNFFFLFDFLIKKLFKKWYTFREMSSKNCSKKSGFFFAQFVPRCRSSRYKRRHFLRPRATLDGYSAYRWSMRMKDD